MKKIKVILVSLYIVPIYFRQFIKLVFNFVLYKKSERFAKNFNIKEVGIDDVLSQVDEKIHSFTSLADTSLPIDILLIKSIVKSFDSPNYLEIGCFRGESLVNIIDHTNNTVSISLSKNELREITKNEYCIEVDSILVDRYNKKLTKIEANSQNFDFLSLEKKFDVIFIDGDHSEYGVFIDTINAFKVLRDENSIIIWHDFGYSPSDLRYDVIAGAIKGTPFNERNNIYRVRNTLCGIYTKKKIAPTISENYLFPNILMDVEMKIRKYKNSNY